MMSYTIEELEELANKFLGTGAEQGSMGAMNDNQLMYDFLEFLKEDATKLIPKQVGQSLTRKVEEIISSFQHVFPDQANLLLDFGTAIIKEIGKITRMN